ncbi:peroxisomal succinyl-coenzyme A thioesterase-like isoform X2 [Crassostrea virginica]
MSMLEVKLWVDPASGLVDEKVRISVEGLSPHEPVTVKAAVEESRMRFCAYGWFTSTGRGQVDLTSQASIHGTYTGVDPMGLFWSMRPEPLQKEHLRLLKKDVTTPLVVTVVVLKGHLDWGKLFDPSPKPLAELKVYRWYKDKSVRRERVRQGNVQGALFTPSGPGPFPGIIDLFSGGTFEHRAALLASHGYCVLALELYNYDDNVTSFFHINSNILNESMAWFGQLPTVLPAGFGIIATSLSGFFAAEITRLSPMVKALVLVNGLTFYKHPSAIPEDCKTDRQASTYSIENAKPTPHGFDAREVHKVLDSSFVKVWEGAASVLYIRGQDDRSLNINISQRFFQQVPEEHKHRFQLTWFYIGAESQKVIILLKRILGGEFWSSFQKNSQGGL